MKTILVLLVAALLGLSATARVAPTAPAVADCCAPGAACCFPGSGCCLHD